MEDLCHLIPKQTIKREVSEDPEVVWHPSIVRPGCRRHHNMLDVSRTLRIPRAKLPPETELFAQHFGMLWWLDREYGMIESREVVSADRGASPARSSS